MSEQKMRAALIRIANLDTPSEISSRGRDFLIEYESVIHIARKALAAQAAQGEVAADERLRKEFEVMLQCAHWTGGHRDINFDRDERDDYESYPVHIAWNVYLRAIARTAPPAPAGWKLVPVTLTQEMTSAGCEVIRDSGGEARWSDMREAWEAMLAAAPEVNRG